MRYTLHHGDNREVLRTMPSDSVDSIVNVTPLEPGWEGHVTIELSNTNTVPVKVYGNEGIAQCLFYQGERPAITYADRRGKYQGQQGVTLPRSGE